MRAPEASVMSGLSTFTQSATALDDPLFGGLLDELARDPEGAMKRHKDNPDVASFIVALSGLLGEHFAALGQQQAQQQVQEEEQLIQGPLVEEELRKRAETGKIVDVTGRDPKAWERERAERAAAEEVRRHDSGV